MDGSRDSILIKGPQQSGRKVAIMPRTKDNADVEAVNEEVEEIDSPEASEDKAPKAKAKKEPARGDLPEGYVTPVGLAKILGEKGLQKNREGEVLTEVKPQMVYSYIKNASKDDPFPIETIQDSIGKDRQAVKVEAAIEWWERKNARTEERKANAAAKAAKKAERAAAKEAADAGETEEAEGEAVEAE